MPFSAVGMNYCQENMKAAVLSKFNSPSPPPTPKKNTNKGSWGNDESAVVISIRFDGFHQEFTSPQNPHKFGEEAVNYSQISIFPKLKSHFCMRWPCWMTFQHAGHPIQNSVIILEICIEILELQLLHPNYD